MLEYLHLKNVGPAPEMEMELASRLNVITGDNGLGKTFLLEIAWWVLTWTWARCPAIPALPPTSGELVYRYGSKNGPFASNSRFDRETERWSTLPGGPWTPGLVLYAQVDGGFSVFDPARNSWKDAPNRPQSYLFAAGEVWDGNALCEGLVRDWGSWQRENSTTYAQLKAVLEALSPSSSELLIPGELRKVSLDDPKRYPTIKMTYGMDVPVIHASAGMRRVLALAYLLVWAWQEHVAASELRGEPPTKEIIFLIDEVEAHLHPEWQRRIVPAVLDVVKVLTGQHDVNAQLVAATHSPLVLASLEPSFDEQRDRVFHLHTEDGNVVLHEVPWAKQGDATNWLVSEVFGLGDGRSIEAERAIEAASAWMRGERDALPPNLSTKEEIHAELLRVLPGHDDFWPRWVVETRSAKP